MWNVIVFILGTVLYYIGKPASIMVDGNSETIPISYSTLVFYFIATLVLQYACNVVALKQKCGGNITDNIGSIFIYTIFPWVFIFGLVIIALLSFPGLKSAFSDVIGYFYVSSAASTLLTELMRNRDIDNQLDAMTSDKKREYEDASDLILKICGNPGILINQIVPSNFNQYWKMLRPLMKSKYQTDELVSEETKKIKQDLFNLVMSRDNVGEFVWYLYTGLLVVSLVQLKLGSKKCNKNIEDMELDYQTYVDAQTKVQEEKALAESTVYVV
jgi:hypothetical protein